MNDFQLVLKFSTDGTGKVKADIVGLKNEFGQSSNAIEDLGKKTKGTSNELASLAKEATKAWVALQGARKIIDDAIDATNRHTAAVTGLAVAARYSGESISGSLNAAFELTTDGLMTTSEAALALKNLLARGFTLDEATQMIMRFKDSAAFGRQSSLKFGEAVVSATEGLKNENSILVDNAGVTKNVSVMWKEYAAKIGKSVNDLTQAEKRQAEFNGIMRETEGMLGNSALAADQLTGSQARFSKSVDDSSRALGEALTPALNAFYDSGTWVMRNVVSPLVGTVQKLGIFAGATATSVGVLWDALSHPIDTAKNFDQFMAKMAEVNNRAERMAAEIDERIKKGANPVIGKDSGARRQDSLSGNDAAEAEKTAKALAAYYDRQSQLRLAAEQAFSDDMQREELEYQAKVEAEDARFAALMEKEKLNNQQKIEAEAAHKQALEDLETLHSEKVINIAQREADQKSRIEETHTRKMESLKGSLVSNSIRLLSELGSKSRVLQQTAIVAETAYAAASIYASSQMAAAAALAPPPLGLGPILGAPLAASISTLGIANAAIVAASGLARLGGASGSSPSTSSTPYAGTGRQDSSRPPESIGAPQSQVREHAYYVTLPPDDQPPLTNAQWQHLLDMQKLDAKDGIRSRLVLTR